MKFNILNKKIFLDRIKVRELKDYPPAGRGNIETKQEKRNVVKKEVKKSLK